MSEKEVTKEAYEYIVHRRRSLELNISASPVGDIGCGAGQNCKVIKGFTICVDIAIRQLLVARSHGCENLVQADMEFLPFRDSSFRHLIYIASIHHLPDPRRALTEAYRVLKDKGKITITVWARQLRFLFKRQTMLKTKLGNKELYRYYRFYFPWEIKRYCEMVGFKTEKCSFYKVKARLLPNNVIYLGFKDSLN